MPRLFSDYGMLLTLRLRSPAGFAAIAMIGGVETGVEKKSRPDGSVTCLTKNLFGIYASRVGEIS